MNSAKSFPPGVSGQLQTYVYRLIDPRNGATFYVGKGTGDRVFSHIQGKVSATEGGAKLKRIHEIHAAGLRQIRLSTLGKNEQRVGSS